MKVKLLVGVKEDYESVVNQGVGTLNKIQRNNKAWLDLHSVDENVNGYSYGHYPKLGEFGYYSKHLTDMIKNSSEISHNEVYEEENVEENMPDLNVENKQVGFDSSLPPEYQNIVDIYNHNVNDNEDSEGNEV